MSNIAIVTPWFGRELKGENEAHAWQLAARLAARGHAVEVLTTRARSEADDWGTNTLPAGATPEPEGHTVRRFDVAPRDRIRFDQAVDRLRDAARLPLRPGVSPLSEEDEKAFFRESLQSPALLRFLGLNKDNYDAVILLPCRHGLVLDGVHAVTRRALLQPWLRDEAYAYLPTLARAAFAARRLVFLNDAERELALRLFGPGIIGKSVDLAAGGARATAGGRSVRGAVEPAAWDAVIARYEEAVEGVQDSAPAALSAPANVPAQAVHQVLPNVAFGDAISNHALWLKQALRKRGFQSEIFALGIDPRIAGWSG